MDYIEYKYIIHQVEEELKKKKKKNPCAFGIWMDYIEYTL